MRMYRLVAVAGAALVLALGSSYVAGAYPGGGGFGHGGGGFGHGGGGFGHGGGGFGHHHGPPPPPGEVSTPGTSIAAGDHVSFVGLTFENLGEVNGFTESKIQTPSPTTSSFFKFPGIQTVEGAENITIFSAASNGETTDAGVDECNPCTLYSASGQELGTGSIDFPWWSASGTTTHQQVALAQHGTGVFANVHGVLTHPGTEDPRCAAGVGHEGFVGCYTGLVVSQECLSGDLHGPLRVGPGQAVCLSPGTRVSGPTSVGKDGELFAERALFDGPIRSDQASGISLCGSSVNGPVSITGTTGPVLIGEPANGGCAGNFIQGALSVEKNGCATCDADHEDTGAVDISGDMVVGPLRVTENVGSFVLGDFAPNTVFGPTVNEDNN